MWHAYWAAGSKSKPTNQNGVDVQAISYVWTLAFTSATSVFKKLYVILRPVKLLKMLNNSTKTRNLPSMTKQQVNK